ncbi:outer membrane beta-barrel protein [Pedobacter sp. UBA4863]|uniref:outer membrane beta-barrel protein n=1 Tax=Pedobacter sp. UBA4863 TaxID=1947060 RepID=UPI0025DE8E8A|nr:outer membrane beta-barrel protein [Pedobacter sp. UBA4863]
MKRHTKFMATAVAALAMFITNANAQTASEPTNPSRQKLGIGVNLGIPTADGYSFALGADLRYQIDIDRQLSVPITAGYTALKIKEDFGGGSVGYIPAKAGLKYFFSDTGAGAYGLAEAGAAFGTNKGAGTSFVYSPAIGYAWNNGLDLSAKYEGLSKDGANNGYVGLRLAYGFKL